MAGMDMKLGATLILVISLTNPPVLAEDEQSLTARNCWRGGRRMPGLSTEAALKEAITRNVCEGYDFDSLFSWFNVQNHQKNMKCWAAVSYLTSTTTIRPDDCQFIVGARCARDENGKAICAAKVNFYNLKSIQHCAQNYKPAGTTPTPTPTPNPTPNPNPSPNTTPIDNQTPPSNTQPVVPATPTP